jgi:hypothetical protein
MRKREFKHAEKLFFLLRVRTHLSIPPTPKGPASFFKKITFRVLLLLSQKFRLAPDEMEHTTTTTAQESRGRYGGGGFEFRKKKKKQRLQQGAQPPKNCVQYNIFLPFLFLITPTRGIHAHESKEKYLFFSTKLLTKTQKNS